jgi:hypothetical protein
MFSCLTPQARTTYMDTAFLSQQQLNVVIRLTTALPIFVHNSAAFRCHANILTRQKEETSSYQLVLPTIGIFRNYFSNFVHSVENMAGLSKFVYMLTESVSQILCKSSNDIVSSDDESIGDKEYAHSEHVPDVSNGDNDENECAYPSHVVLETGRFKRSSHKLVYMGLLAL